MCVLGNGRRGRCVCLLVDAWVTVGLLEAFKEVMRSEGYTDEKEKGFRCTWIKPREPHSDIQNPGLPFVSSCNASTRQTGT